MATNVKVKANPKQTVTKVSAGEALGQRLLQAVREMNAGKAARVTVVESNEVVQARQSVGLTQAEFAEALSISRRTLQEWEQGRRNQSGAAQTLIRIAKRHPKIMLESLS